MKYLGESPYEQLVWKNRIAPIRKELAFLWSGPSHEPEIILADLTQEELDRLYIELRDVQFNAMIEADAVKWYFQDKFNNNPTEEWS